MKYLKNVLHLAEKEITVAVSGGIDSLAILRFLSKNKKFKVRAWHFNHKIRPQNDEMEKSVRNFCLRYDVPLTVSSCQKEYSGGSKEAFYRKERYSSLNEVGGFVVLGHHLNDYVENYLNNCFKGHRDYIPMPLVSKWEKFTVLRPFAVSSKEDLKDYIEKENLNEWVVEDETNDDETIQRNWLRGTLIPQIQDKNYNLERVVKKIVLERNNQLTNQ